MFKLNKDSVQGTFIVITGLCLVCSVLVSLAVVALEPFKAAAIANDRQVNIVKVSGFEIEDTIAGTFNRHIEPHLIDVATGTLADGDFTVEEMDSYNFKSLSKKANTSDPIEKEKDLGGILRRSKLMPVYFSKDEEGTVQRVILPFYGQGLWSTCYGYLAVSPEDGNTVKAITFYEHGETPGLGGEIENPRWQSIWVDKKLTDEQGEYQLRIVKNPDPNSAEKDFEVDALSGATLTSRGVNNFTKYWFGDAYQPFLQKLSKGEIIGVAASEEPQAAEESEAAEESDAAEGESEAAADESEAAEDESEAAADESEAAEDESEAAEDESEATEDESEAAEDESEVAEDESEAAEGESEAAADESETEAAAESQESDESQESQQGGDN